MDCIITIDIGTAQVKVSAFDTSARLVAARRGAYPTFHPQPDQSEQDPEQIFLTVLYALKSLLNEGLDRKHRPIALIFGASMHSLLPIDKHGVPLRNAVIWADNRGHNEADALRQHLLGQEIYEATGTPLHPMSPLVKLCWFKNHTPASWFERVYKFISIKEYILFQLTGQLVIDHSMASATGLLNIHQFGWEQKALHHAGVRMSQLSEVVPIHFDELKLKKEYVRLFRLPSSTKIIIGASDGCLATLGAGVVKEGDATITIGSSGAVRVAGSEVIKDPHQRFFNYVLTPDIYISGGPTNNGGVVFEWFAQQLGASGLFLDLEQSVEQLLREAERVPAGAGGLLFLPYLLGERAPLWNANVRGAYIGTNITHERKHFVRATIEGVVYEIHSIGKLLQQYRNIENLYLNGNYATRPLVAQIIADVFGKAVHINDQHDSASTGAALLALTHLGIYPTLPEAAQTVRSVETYQPDAVTHERYARFTQIFERLSQKLQEDFDALVALQA
ncbi:MAG: gluconokinase [Spirosomaceae bacterium]|nr:gluconokinase [Spirosomataceae bacterium]